MQNLDFLEKEMEFNNILGEIEDIGGKEIAQVLRQYLLQETGTGENSSFSYKDRISRSENKFLESIRRNVEDKAQLDDIIAYYYEAILSSQDVYTEIGILMGLKVVSCLNKKEYEDYLLKDLVSRICVIRK